MIPMDKLTHFPATDPISKIQRNINKMFDDISAIKWFDDQGFKDDDIFKPKSDIVESNDNYIINIDLPGLSKNDVKLTYKDNCIIVNGERKTESLNKNAEFHRHELYTGKFYRSFTLPNMGSWEDIQASMKDGILTITVPKSEQTRTKEITIQ